MQKGLEYVTLDPFDRATAAVWERLGFSETLTRAQEDSTVDY
jgi:hypothetical protein